MVFPAFSSLLESVFIVLHYSTVYSESKDFIPVKSHGILLFLKSKVFVKFLHYVLSFL